jgi:hypothetical protein
MSHYSDSDYSEAMEAILDLADPENGYKELSLEDAISRLKKIADIAEGGDIPSNIDDDDDDDEEK